jgi:MarR family transcriptional regulator, organic hydroperoxide resistance regulator
MIGDQKLGLLLFLVSRAHHNLGDRVFGQLGLHRGQPPVLLELEHQDGISQTKLAKKVEVTPVTITNMLRRMEQAGLILRIRNEADTRISKVFLTDYGKSILEQAKTLIEKMDQAAFAGFSTEEKNQMKDFFQRIHQNLIKEIPD